MVLGSNGGASHCRGDRKRDRVHAGHWAYRIPAGALFLPRAQHHCLSNSSAFLVPDTPYRRIPGTPALDLLDTYHWNVGSGDIWLLHYGTLCFFISVEPS